MLRRLKSLELQGIKTFATTTLLEFPGQITAIVGPNGSGKSNIADSIRWVLGEQSYSLLRAKRTEDMIFSGSQQRSRSGMAMATITFDNEDGWLPIDYSEISISRRAYRDGQNEYLLNGQKVRLKDISELLSQTGLSERTYTIIGQGLVDAALALKPDERRKLFEEAAGIGLYRTRKEEALRRLENTRKNLDRILDILSEIKPRLRSLERQAERFSEYERLRSDLEVLLQEWYGFHWHQKQQDLSNSRKAFQDQEARLANLRQLYSEAGRKVEEARKAYQANRKALQESHHELSEYHQNYEQVTRELAILDERQRSQKQQKSHLDVDIANLQEEIADLVSQQRSFEEEIQKRLLVYESSTEQVQQAEMKLAEITAEKEKTANELDRVRNERVGQETRHVQKSAHIEELSNRITALDKEKGKIEEAEQHLETEIAELEKSSVALESGYQEAIEAFRVLESSLNSKSLQMDEIRSDRQKLDEQNAALEAQEAKLKTQIDVLSQAEAALSGYSEGSKVIVEDSRKGRLPNGIEPLSKHLIIDEKFEKAISATMGELTDLLIVPSNVEDVVIEYLETNENERVALIALDQKKQQQTFTKLPDGMEILGYANELIEVESQFRNLVDSLFSDTLIVKDRKSAQKIARYLKGTEKVVTLNGVVFQANGILVSGRNASGKRIGRTRRLSELQSALVQAQEEIKELGNKRKNINQTSENIEQEISDLKLALHEKEDQRNQAKQILQAVNDNITRNKEQLVWYQDRLAALSENLQKTHEEITKEEFDLKNYKAEIENFHKREKSIQADLLTLPVFELQQSLNHWQTQSIVAKNAYESSRQRYQDQKTRLEEVQQRLEMYQSRKMDLEQQLVEIDESKEKLTAEEAIIGDEIKRLEAIKIAPLTTTGEEIEISVTALEKEETDIHQQMIVAERHFTQLQLELSRRDDQLNILRERIEDDFGLVSFEYEQKMDGPAPLPLGENLIHNLPKVKSLAESIESDMKRLKGQIRRVGAINPEAQQEYHEVKERYEFLQSQIGDLEKASKDLREVIEKLDSMMEMDFLKTFKAVDREFSEYFSRLFNGGEAKLLVSDEDDPVEGGIDIEARLPGRRSQSLALLSGGERSLTAVALIFALLKVSPTPFCILDEVDAMLDESNVGRFADLLRELANKIQFVIITHNRNTVQAADVIYGVTMGRDSTSQMISLKLEEVDETYLE